MITMSTSMSAAVATGSSSVTASPIAAVGGIPASNNWGAGTVLQPFSLAQEDPFANVDVPTPTTPCQNFTNSENKPGGAPITITPASGEIMFSTARASRCTTQVPSLPAMVAPSC